MISKEGVAVDPCKVISVTKWPTPKLRLFKQTSRSILIYHLVSSSNMIIINISINRKKKAYGHNLLNKHIMHTISISSTQYLYRNQLSK